MLESETHLCNLTSQLQELQSHGEALQQELRGTGGKLVEAQDEGRRLHDLERQADSSLAQAKERQVRECVLHVVSHAHTVYVYVRVCACVRVRVCVCACVCVCVCVHVGGAVRAAGHHGTGTTA